MGGTRQISAVAVGLNRPVLPLPFADGGSREAWSEHKELVVASFKLSTEEAERFDGLRLERLEATEVTDLAREVVAVLLRSIRPKVFIAMPFAAEFEDFYRLLESTLDTHGFEAVRTDKLHVLGNVITHIREGIAGCDLGLAVLSGFNPNVMYELALLHADRKPVILLCEHRDSDAAVDLPFDIQGESTIFYSRDEYDELSSVLGRHLKQFRQMRRGTGT